MNEKTTYVALEPIDADRRYEPGEPIDLTVDQAKPLLGVRAIAEPTAEDGQALQQVAGSLHFYDADTARIVQLGEQLDIALTELAERGATLQVAEAALQQARDDIQALQTAKAEAASALAELQARHGETLATNSALVGEVAELQARLATATATATASTTTKTPARK